MEKTSGTTEKLLEEISDLKKKISKLEKAASQYKQMEEALRESELKYRSVVECSSDAIFCVDEKGEYKFTNSLFASTFGKSPDYFIGKTFWDIYPKEHADKRYEVTKRVFATGRSESVEVEVPLPDKTLYFYAIADPIHDENGKVILNLTHAINITERKLAEAQSKAALNSLRESEQSLAEAQHIARIGSWDWDMISNTVKWSKEMYRVFGISADTFDGKPESLLKVIHPDDVELFTNCMKGNLSKGNPTSLEFRVIHKSGSIHHIFAAGRVEFNDSGSPIRNIGTAQDITERKQAEDALSFSLEKYRALVENITDVIFTVDLQGTFTFVSPAIEKISGYTSGEVKGMHFSSFIHPDDLNGLAEAFTKTVSGIRAAHKFRVLDKAGAVRWVVTRSRLVAESGAPPVITGVMADITEHRQADDALRESEEKFSKAFKTSPYAITITRPEDGKIIEVNDAFTLMTGFTREEAISNSTVGLKLWVSDEDRKFVVASLSKGQAVVGKELRFRTKSGKIITGLFSAQLIKVGIETCILSSIDDITERKQVEEDRSKLEAQLFQSQKMEAIGTLAGGIAHDFNNILAVIIGYTELAMDKNQKGNKDKYLQETLHGAERAKNLVKQILAFSRHDNNEKKPLDIKVLLKEAAKFLRASIPTTVEIDLHVADESCNIMADPTQMHQVIMNLCTNAAHAMKHAGGTLKIELANIELAQDEIPYHPELKPGHYVKLTVSDTGHGIDPDNIQRVFDPFFTTKTKDEGTGLGLSVVYGIVKSHDGVITVYSEKEKGAAFHVYLPRIIQTEAMEMDAGKSVIGGTERILFVDDEPTLVDIGLRMLFCLGYQAAGATSSIEALDIFRADPQRFDLVITDMTLPKMTGIDLSRKLLQIRPGIPIILCSGIREPDTEAQAKSLGIKAYLTKPLTRRELAGVMRKVLDGG
ncbi:MAG: PAS domain S-box protein [Deltaproteobacteria bacterium]